jgi:hypothetical protein
VEELSIRRTAGCGCGWLCSAFLLAAFTFLPRDICGHHPGHPGGRGAGRRVAKLVALTENTATIETRTGARQTYRRRPVLIGEISLAWELVLR